MKTVKTLILAFILLINCYSYTQTKSQVDLLNEGKSLAKQAYLKYDKDIFLKALNIFEGMYKADNSDFRALYYITLVDYKLLEIGTREGGEQLFDKYYDWAIKNAETLSMNKSYEADGKILLAGIYMMKIAVSSMSAVSLSPKIHALLDEAQKIAPEKPYSYVIRGIMKFNTPGIFGGSYEDALKNFNQAIKLFEKDEDANTLNPVWGYLETLAWAGRTQEKLDNDEAAVFTYKKALKEESEFAWVKYNLLPQLEKKLSGNN